MIVLKPVTWFTDKLRPVFMLVLMSSLIGCITVLPESTPSTAFYALKYKSEDSASAIKSDLSIAVNLPTMPFSLSGRDMAVSDENEAVRYLRATKWEDAPPQMLRNLLLDALAHHGLKAISADMAARTDYEIAWRVTRFEAQKSNDQSEVRMTASAVWLDHLRRPISKEFTFEHSLETEDLSAKTVAASLNQIANMISDEIASKALDIAKGTKMHIAVDSGDAEM